MRPIPRALVAATALAAAAFAARAAATVKLLPKTKIVSVRLKNSPPGQSAVTGNVSVSASGRFVAWSGDASDLVAGDANGQPDCFVRDLVKKKTVIVSAATSGTNGGDGFSSNAVVSGNGAVVAFLSGATNLVAGDGNGMPDVFVRFLKTRETRLVSVRLDGTAAGAGIDLGISSDGNIVVFTTTATGLGGADGNAVRDVYARNLSAATTTLVSVNAAGTGVGDGFSLAPVLTPNGRFVAFRTAATNLGAADANSSIDVVLRDLTSATPVVVSVDPSGTRTGNGPSGNPHITPDGAHVAFESTASDLVPGDQNVTQDVFVRDIAAGTTTLVSRNKAGTGSAGSFSNLGGVSDDGRFVAFESDAADVADNDANAAKDVFLRDLQTGTTALVSANSARTGPGDGPSFGALISGDGRYVVFQSQAKDLVPGDTNGASNLFVRDTKTGVTSLISSNFKGKTAATGSSGSPALAGNGRTLVFTSDAADLVAKDTDAAFDVFVRSIR